MMRGVADTASDVIERCRLIAACSIEPGFTTRPFLTAPMKDVHALLSGWMTKAGMDVSIDAVGNIRGLYASARPGARRLFIGSHLDTVPRAGPYDGVLGVVMGVTLIELLDRRPLDFDVEVIGFSEEEGLRFGVPFIGSRALIGDVDEELLGKRDGDGIRVAEAIRGFGLDPENIGAARVASGAIGFFEFHIEQGPVLEDLGLQLGVVERIAGQSRLRILFKGATNHAGTTPMRLRRDALTAASQWIGEVESEARSENGLVATVGRLEIEPGAGNVIPGLVRATLDVRHAEDSVRHGALERILESAAAIAAKRKIDVSWETQLDQPAVAMDESLTKTLSQTLQHAGYPVHRMVSGAGHDAMVLARKLPAAMLFLRSPGGISHHSSESVLEQDVAAALKTGLYFLEEIAKGAGRNA
jgi:allantoate deiminase